MSETDWRAAGHRADASRIRSVLQEKFAGLAKTVVRQEVASYLKAAGVERPLDLWGGGLSAEVLVAEGMRPIVVDDARAADIVAEAIGQRVTKPRFLRAMQLSGEAGGYETRTGAIATHAVDADGAFLDFCGHWSSQVGRALRACSHMKAIAVTLMPERTPLGQLSLDDWKVAYTALIEKATGMPVRRAWVYVRNDSGQRAIVFMLRASRVSSDQTPEAVKARRAEYLRSYKALPDTKARDREREREYLARPGVRERKRENERKRNARPEVKARMAEYLREYNQRPEVRARRAEYQQRPEVKAREAEYRSRPEVKARVAENNRRYFARPDAKAHRAEYNQRPEVKARKAEWKREYLARPGVKARVAERAHESYMAQKEKAA
jgi:hypothetical protein